MKLPIFYDWNATWEYMFPRKDINSTFRGLHSHCKPITVANIENFMHIALVWHIFTPINVMFAWLIIHTFPANEQYFSLTINQTTILLIMAYQPSEPGIRV